MVNFAHKTFEIRKLKPNTENTVRLQFITDRLDVLLYVISVSAHNSTFGQINQWPSVAISIMHRMHVKYEQLKQTASQHLTTSNKPVTRTTAAVIGHFT